MKNLISFLSLAILMAFASCSGDSGDVSSNDQAQFITVQGQPYDLSKSTVPRTPILKSADTSNGGDPNFTMNDIKFWVGEGSNKAAVVIEWHDGKSSDALVWGYKWNGIAYGYDMVKAIAKADPRLIFLTHMSGSLGYTVGGIGYNINKTGFHYLVYNGDLNDPKYPVNGIVSTTAYNYDSWTYSDASDHWCSGWYNGYWSYFIKGTQDEAWQYSGYGASSRPLVNGSWDGWSFLGDMSEWEGAMLGNTFTAASPN